ncbi:MAG TPA: hypothetical protein VI670_02520 [Thermoanaerobaculia bacterium]
MVAAGILVPASGYAQRRRASLPPGLQFRQYALAGVAAIDDLAVSADGTVWFAGESATADHMVGYLSSDRTPVLIPVTTKVDDIAATNDAAWCAAGHAILRIDKSQSVRAILASPNIGISRIAIDYSGAVWFLTSEFVSRLDPVTESVTGYKLPSSLAYPSGLAIGMDNSIWLVTRRSVGHLAGNGIFVEYRNDALFSSMGSRELYFGFVSVLAVPGGAIWAVATSTLGPTFISAPRGSFVVRVLPSGGLEKIIDRPGDTIYDIVAGDQAVWVADCSCAPYSLDKSRLQRYSLDATLSREIAVPTTGHFPEKVVNRIVPSPDGTLWLTYRDQPVIVNLVWP